MIDESSLATNERMANRKFVVGSRDELNRAEITSKEDRLLMIQKAMDRIEQNTSGVTLGVEKKGVVLRYKGEPAYEGDKGRDVVITELKERASDPVFWDKWVEGPLMKIIGKE